MIYTKVWAGHELYKRGPQLLAPCTLRRSKKTQRPLQSVYEKWEKFDTFESKFLRLCEHSTFSVYFSSYSPQSDDHSHKHRLTRNKASVVNLQSINAHMNTEQKISEQAKLKLTHTRWNWTFKILMISNQELVDASDLEVHLRGRIVKNYYIITTTEQN